MPKPITTPRILIGGDFLWCGGAESVSTQLANLFHRLGHETQLHCFISPSGVLRSRIDDGVEVTGTEYLPESTQTLVRSIVDGKPDLLIANHSYPTLVIARQLREHIGHVVSVMHAPIDKYLPSVARDMRKAVDCYVGVSDEVCQWLIDHGVPAGKVLHLPNLVDCEVYRPGRVGRIGLTKPYGRVEKDEILIGYVGRISPEKCVPTIVKAYMELRRRGHPVRLAIVGGDDRRATGPGIDEYRELVQDEQQRVELLSRRCVNEGIPVPSWTRETVADVVPWYRAIDVLVLASRYEGHPLVALEAMACGTPVILPDIGGCPDLVTMAAAGRGSASTGILYERGRPGLPPDMGSLTRALGEFLSRDPENREHMGRAARSFVIERHSVGCAGAGYADQLLAGARRGSAVSESAAGPTVAPCPASTDGDPRDYLVTGGCGFIGSTLVRQLVRSGSTVRVLDDMSTGRLDNLQGLGTAVGVVEGSVTDPDLVAEVMDGCVGVFHLAAMTSVPRSFEEPERCRDVNVGGTRNVIAAADGRRVIFASSSSVYGLSEPPQTEDYIDGATQLSPYAETKAVGDHLVREAGGVAMRFFNVFGPRQLDDSPYTGVIALFCRGLLDGTPLVIYGDGLQSRGFIYVSDVASACMAAMMSPDAAGEAFNISSRRSVSVWELLTRLADSVGELRAPVEMAPARKGDIRDSLGDISKARELLGWSPRIGIEEGLRRTLSWYRRPG